MDYAEIANVTRHRGWTEFEQGLEGRLVLLTTRGDVRLDEARFEAGDVLLLGSESAGVPAEVHARADLRVRIPQAAGTRSLNIAVAAGIAIAEALRQTGDCLGPASIAGGGRGRAGCCPARRERWPTIVTDEATTPGGKSQPAASRSAGEGG